MHLLGEKMTPQKNYSKWKQEQGLPVSGLDVTSGDTVQIIPITPAEEAIKIAMLLRYLSQNESGQ
jgi:hypothetical protein